MNIGIDAKWFFKGNPSGKVVIRNLVRELLANDTTNQFYIFLRKEDKLQDFPHKGNNVHLVYIWAKNNLLSNLFITPFYVRKYKIDVCLYQYFSPFIRFSKTITLIHDVIFESHPEYFSSRERIYFKPMKLLAGIADRIVTVSGNEKDRLIKYGYGNSDKVSAIHLGVSERFLAPKNELSKAGIKQKLQLPDRFVLYVGRLNYRKNIHNLIRAFHTVTDKDLTLVLAGGYDWKMFDVKAFIAGEGLEDRVRLLGFVDDEDLPALYAAAELFCFVSQDEGFGLPPLEAMASGVPVIVADKGSLPEICGDAGIYVDPDKPGEIGKEITRLTADKDLLKKKCEKGLQRASEFTWKQTAIEYSRLFNQAVQKDK